MIKELRPVPIMSFKVGIVYKLTKWQAVAAIGQRMRKMYFMKYTIYTPSGPLQFVANVLKSWHLQLYTGTVNRKNFSVGYSAKTCLYTYM
jgi:hypothetical protein